VENDAENSIFHEAMKDNSKDIMANNVSNQIVITMINNQIDANNSHNDNKILDNLISPLKADYEFERWALKDIAIFECAMCNFGKKYMIIGK